MRPRNCLKMAHVFKLQHFLPVGGNVINLPRELLLISRAAKWQGANCGSVTQNYLPLRPPLLWNRWQELQTRSIAITHFQTMRVFVFAKLSQRHFHACARSTLLLPVLSLSLPTVSKRSLLRRIWRRRNASAGVWDSRPVKNSASDLSHSSAER